MTPIGLACFDFDWTLIETDSDRFVMEGLSPTLRERLNRPTMQWTDLLNACLQEYHEQGGTKQDVINAMKKAPMDSSMIEVCKLLHSHGWTLVILSDSNAVYIDEILKHHEIRHLFSAVITNPAHWDEQGRLHIQRLIPVDAPPHSCPTGTCSVNICKGQELDRLMQSLGQLTATDPIAQAASITATSLVGEELEDNSTRSLRMLYVGDGRNDYCPALRMRNSHDLFFVRRGRTLEYLLTEFPATRSAIQSRIVLWDHPSQVLEALQAEDLKL
ncbi:hypothetical protein BX616_007224 [Lobosporangium transversale]|uniref:Putative phosphatase-domain-containing protein n=1 Tax=Lobosporangium transversale TaxID=64571 RepID=A0A1Y2GC41_9FUNG|nr:putative phosphatase-domain-containing protein [Lobosporangium transversale]KAF9914954.1 hypothetical protein BX616_007224 [Lobosporangium transversale]ORZ06766.1 putative phosphatase-domain-containing protein [Lobosporangium transversale]|eukprot:XP_021877687.1 putative phosphatase-domain-containing protein [Lobosporangium transversale]